jgi:DNA repair ATPase RecN
MEHDCEFFLITNVAVYACECDPHHIEIDKQEYVPIEKYLDASQQNEALSENLRLANKQIEALQAQVNELRTINDRFDKGVQISELRQQIKSLESKNTQLVEALREMEVQNICLKKYIQTQSIRIQEKIDNNPLP